MVKEIWRAVPGWSKYEVGNHGRVRYHCVRVRKLRVDKDGYFRVSLADYEQGYRRCEPLAGRYGVCKATIGAIKNGMNWGWL